MTVFTALTTTVLPTGYVGVAYEASFAVNYAAASELIISAGTTQTGKQALPSGLSYGSTARITGTPAAGTAGTYLLSIKVTDGTTVLDNQAFTLVIEYPGTDDIAYLEATNVTAVVAKLDFGG